MHLAKQLGKGLLGLAHIGTLLAALQDVHTQMLYGCYFNRNNTRTFDTLTTNLCHSIN